MPLGNQYSPIPLDGNAGDVLTKDSTAPNAYSWQPAGAGTGDVTKDAIASGTTITSIADTDVLAVVTPGTPNVLRKIAYSAFKTLMNGLYALTGHNHNSSYVAKNTAITGATKTKITYDAKGLVTSGSDATQDDIGDGTTNKQYSATDKSKLAGIEASADVTDIGNVSTVIGGASAATPVDADKFPFYDDTDSTLKTVTGTSLKTYIGASGLDIHGLTAETTLAADDEFPFYDITASANRKVVFSDIQKDTINKHYFVGIVIMIDNATTNPNTLYNWQTWVRVDGGFAGMYKSGDANFGTAGATVYGGSLTKNMQHTHTTPSLSHSGTAVDSHGITPYVMPFDQTTPMATAVISFTIADHTVTQPSDHAAGNTGNGLSTTQDVLNPGWVLCFWRRTA